jgi:hypothetical protein
MRRVWPNLSPFKSNPTSWQIRRHSSLNCRFRTISAIPLTRQSWLNLKGAGHGLPFLPSQGKMTRKTLTQNGPVYWEQITTPIGTTIMAQL